jgi:hypothetical protein
MPILKINISNVTIGLVAIIIQVLMLGYGRSIRYMRIQFSPEKYRLDLFDRLILPVIYAVAFQLAFHAAPSNIVTGVPYLIVAVLVMQSSKPFRTGEWFWRFRFGDLKYYDQSGKTHDPADIWRETTRYRLMAIGMLLMMAYLWLRNFRGVVG